MSGDTCVSSSVMPLSVRNYYSDRCLHFHTPERVKGPLPQQIWQWAWQYSGYLWAMKSRICFPIPSLNHRQTSPARRIGADAEKCKYCHENDGGGERCGHIPPKSPFQVMATGGNEGEIHCRPPTAMDLHSRSILWKEWHSIQDHHAPPKQRNGLKMKLILDI